MDIRSGKCSSDDNMWYVNINNKRIATVQTENNLLGVMQAIYTLIKYGMLDEEGSQ